MLEKLKEKYIAVILYMTEIHHWRLIIVIIGLYYILADYFNILTIDNTDILLFVIVCYASICDFIKYYTTEEECDEDDAEENIEKDTKKDTKKDAEKDTKKDAEKDAEKEQE